MRDEPQPVARAVARGLLDGALGGDGAILVRERARDPGDVVVRDERRERRHEPAGAAPCDARARLVAREPERTAIGDDDQLPPRRHLRGRLYGRSLTKRSRDPRPLAPPPISTSSAIERMIAIPRPPSESSASSPFCAAVVRLEARAVVGDLDDQPVVPELEADRDVALVIAVGVPDRVRARLRQRQLQVGERLVRERADAGEAGESEPGQRDVFRLRRNRQPDRPALVGGVRCAAIVRSHSPTASFYRKLPNPRNSYPLLFPGTRRLNPRR